MIPAIRNSFYFVVESAADAAAFAGLGLLTTCGLNLVSKTHTVKNLLGDLLPQINVVDAAAACAGYLLIDQMAKTILLSTLDDRTVNRSSVTLLRKAGSVIGSLAIISALPAEWALSALDFKIAALVIGSTVLVYKGVEKLNSYLDVNFGSSAKHKHYEYEYGYENV